MTEKSQLSYENISIEKLIPYANNARIHSDEQVTQIAASIREFGFNDPIIVDERNSILAGHGRKLAALKLDLHVVPVVRVEGLTEAQKKAFIIASNKLGDNSSYDLNVLQVELEGLKELGIDLELTGFSDFEIKALEAGDFGEMGEVDFDDAADYEGGDEEAADTRCIIGEYSFPIPRENYLEWLEEIKQDHGFDTEAVLAAIKAKLGLT